MKYIYKIYCTPLVRNLLLILFLFPAIAHAQDKKKLLDIVDKNIQQLEQVQKLFTLRLRLESGDNKAFDPNDPFAIESNVSLKSQDDNALQKFYDSLEVSYYVNYPYSFFIIKKDEDKLQKILGKDHFYFMENRKMKPVFIPVSLEYLDGSTMNISDNYFSVGKVERHYKRMVKEKDTEYEVIDTTRATEIEKEIYKSESSFREAFAIPSAKAVKKITFSIVMPTTATHTFFATKEGDENKTKDGSIKLAAIAANEIAIQYPSAMDKKLQIRGIYKDGRILKQKSSNSNTIITEEQQKGINELIAVLKKTRGIVQEGKINSIEALERHLEENTPKSIADADDHDDEANKQYTEKHIRFSGPVSKVAFLVSGNDTLQKSFKSSYDFSFDKNEMDYDVAEDFATGKTGILGNDGKWRVQPAYDENLRMMNRYYFTDQINDRENIYHFDPQSNKLGKINYRLDEYGNFS